LRKDIHYFLSDSIQGVEGDWQPGNRLARRVNGPFIPPEPYFLGLFEKDFYPQLNMIIYGSKNRGVYIQSSQSPTQPLGEGSLLQLGQYISAVLERGRTFAESLPPPLLRIVEYFSAGLKWSIFALQRWGIFLIVAMLASSLPAGLAAIHPVATSVAQNPAGAPTVFTPTPLQPSSTSTSAVTPTPVSVIPPIIQNNPLSPTVGIVAQPSFPIRAAFYYPWYPEAWKQQSYYPYTNYTPSLGLYSSRDVDILKQHIAMMQHAHIDAGIASWWGQGSQTDGKIDGLLSAAAGTNFHWALYYEDEGQENPTVSQIQSDLAYIRDHYGESPNFLRVDGNFVVFVYSDRGDRCGMADRWKQANTVGAYIVLRIFPGYAKCASQPDSWHQYSPATAVVQVGEMSYAISPGFWLKGGSVRLERDIDQWSQNVRDMVASGAKWQLIETFNEWGEGTAVEPAEQWSSSSGYGLYLDELYTNGGESPP
jgi:hypothetical protein